MITAEYIHLELHEARIRARLLLYLARVYPDVIHWLVDKVVDLPRPNPDQTWAQLFDQAILWRERWGRAEWHIDHNKQEVWVTSPQGD